MALETLKGLTEIGGYKVVVMDELREKFPERFNESGAMDYTWFESEIRPHHFVYIRHDVNSISFTIQNGPIKEVGVNGCQLDTLIHTAMIMIDKLNEKFPCNENIGASGHLHAALRCLDERKKNREARGVEGFSKA
jgi:hypothetical protein